MVPVLTYGSDGSEKTWKFEKLTEVKEVRIQEFTRSTKE
jgi:hypothetical protein